MRREERAARMPPRPRRAPKVVLLGYICPIPSTAPQMITGEPQRPPYGGMGLSRSKTSAPWGVQSRLAPRGRGRGERRASPGAEVVPPVRRGHGSPAGAHPAPSPSHPPPHPTPWPLNPGGKRWPVFGISWSWRAGLLAWRADDPDPR
jgi:hypothetical protein